MRITGQPHTSSQEEGTYFPEFPPSRAHLLLEGVYGYHPYNNSGSHPDRDLPDEDLWKHHWRRLAAKSAI